MKKIFFIFAMMFMPLISAFAEESSESFMLDQAFYNAGHYSCTGNHFVVVGDNLSDFGDGMYISNGDKITVRSQNGEKITKVIYEIGYGYGYNDHLMATSGVVSHPDYIINDVNATELVIDSDVEGEYSEFTIIGLKVYYEEPEVNGGEEENTSIPGDRILFEGFATTTGTEYEGTNVQVTGTEANANGLSIGNGKTVTISNNSDEMKIHRVELYFKNDFNGRFNNMNGYVVEGSGKNWTISNIYLPDDLTISSSDNSGQIDSVAVYYVKMSEEKNVAITTTNGYNDYLAGDGLIKVSGTKNNGQWGLYIDNGNSVTITSVKGAEISKVKVHIFYNGFGFNPDKIRSTAGTIVKGYDGYNDDNHWTINDINSSSLTIFYSEASDCKVQIDGITVYYKEPVANSTMDVAANFAGGYYWTTFYSNASNYVAPEGTQVFKVNLNGTKVTMIPIEDGIVNRYEGVVLKSESDNIITMTKTDNNSTDGYVGNSLKGTAYKISNPGNAYVLNYRKSGGVAFYKLSDNGTLAANKAYLQANTSAAANAFFTFDFDETATGVDSINAQDSEENADVKIYYDLQGRRVAKPGKGIYIVNGKKVLMK